MVTDVDERGIEVSSRTARVERIESVTKVWAAGVQASPLTATLAEQTGAPLDRAGRIEVHPDLTLPGHPEVFVVGDMIDLDHLPGVAQVAIQGAKYAAKAITAGWTASRRRSRSSTSTRARWPPSPGSARWPRSAGCGFTGFIAWLLWLVVHLALPDRLQEPGHRACCTGRSASSAAAAPSGRPPSSRSSAGRRSSGSTTAPPTWSRVRESTTRPPRRSLLDGCPATGRARGAGAGRDPVDRLGRARPPPGGLTARQSSVLRWSWRFVRTFDQSAFCSNVRTTRRTLDQLGDVLEHDGEALADPDADRGDAPALAAGAFSTAASVPSDPAAGGAERVADRDRAAAGVDDRGVDLPGVDAGEGLRRRTPR